MSPWKMPWLPVVAKGLLAVVPFGATPALAQTTPSVSEEWRRTVPNHVGVMVDLDGNDNVFAVGYGGPVVTR